MAALLKKRALAEYSEVIEEVPKPKPLKKLCLSKKPTYPGIVDLELLKSSNSSECLQLLIELSDSLPNEADDVISVYRVLLEHLHKERESAIRVKIVSILRQLVDRKLIESTCFLDDIVPIIKSETSHKVLAHLIETFHALGKVGYNELRMQQKILHITKQYLTDKTHSVVSACLKVISDFTPVDVQSETNSLTLKILGEYSHNQDPRIRTSALEALVHLHNRGLKLDINLCDEACKALNDDYEGVRMVALKLVKILSFSYADHLITVEGGSEKIRLCDDIFGKICEAINDLSKNVRVLAASLLGEMKHVSLHFLEQTLDKKLMSNLRKKRSAHERQKENYESGEWSTGQRWADDAPREEVNMESVNLMSSGACGAFVHGLEDEFYEVRSASLDSLCQLAVCYPSFAAQSLDFLVDMFNDEIEDVRLKAIQCLGCISNHIVLREDQLETILGVLEDFSRDIREALHTMLGSCPLSTKYGLKLCIDNLLENLKRYPQDKLSIWRCLKHVGSNHPYLTLPLVPELLGIHPYFDSPEPCIDDPAYISILILVFNAAASCPTMIPLFEEHTLRHYSYLCDTFPTFVSKLHLPNQSCTPAQVVTSTHHSRTFLQQVLEQIDNAEHRSATAKQGLLQIAIRDLEKLSTIEPSLSAAASCASLYIQCQLLLTKLLSNKNWMNPSVLSPLQNSALKSGLEQLLQLTYYLSHQFLGLYPDEIAYIRQLRVRALALQLVIVIRGSNVSALALCESFLEQVEALQSDLQEHSINPDSFTLAMFRELETLEEPKPGSVARLLQPLLQAYPCPSFHLNISGNCLERIKKSKAVIHEPTGESDNPVKFTAGLVAGLTLDAFIENVNDVKNVRVKVKYPDQQVQLILPKLSEFKFQENQNYRLYTVILLSHNVWSEACHVEISLVLDFSDTENIASMKSSGKPWFGSKTEDQTIPLCKPVLGYIAPKPAKKGI